MRKSSEKFVELVRRAFGALTEAQAGSAAERPWIGRGVGNAAVRLGVTSAEADEIVEVVAVWSFAFEAGAIHALQFAQVILSDPAIRGHEDEVMKLIEQGLGHAEIRAALRANQPASKPGPQGNVVAFGRSGGKP